MAVNGYSLETRQILEQPVPGKRLGRHVYHDSRSLAYRVDKVDLSTLKSVAWQRRIPILDQGELGSCTGNAALGCLGTEPFFSTLADWFIDSSNVLGDEDRAVNIYSQATAIDEFPGQYPPEDTGSSGLGVAKVCKKLGLISGYRHATSINGAFGALQKTPIITGTYWYDSFDEPESDGRIRLTPDAQVRGGHEYLFRQLDVENQRVWMDNSWTDQWGIEGRAYLTWGDYEQLLSRDGDATIFVPLTQPPPQPTPPSDFEEFKKDVQVLWAAFSTAVKKLCDKYGIK
jgi:hypothetical protein